MVVAFSLRMYFFISSLDNKATASNATVKARTKDLNAKHDKMAITKMKNKNNFFLIFPDNMRILQISYN